jgi:hypothetical protein
MPVCVNVFVWVCWYNSVCQRERVCLCWKARARVCVWHCGCVCLFESVRMCVCVGVLCGPTDWPRWWCCLLKLGRADSSFSGTQRRRHTANLGKSSHPAIHNTHGRREEVSVNSLSSSSSSSLCLKHLKGNLGLVNFGVIWIPDCPFKANHCSTGYFTFQWTL